MLKIVIMIPTNELDFILIDIGCGIVASQLIFESG